MNFKFVFLLIGTLPLLMATQSEAIFGRLTGSSAQSTTSAFRNHQPPHRGPGHMGPHHPPHGGPGHMGPPPHKDIYVTGLGTVRFDQPHPPHDMYRSDDVRHKNIDLSRIPSHKWNWNTITKRYDLYITIDGKEQYHTF